MCRFIVWGFALAYAFALAILLIGLFGLFALSGPTLWAWRRLTRTRRPRPAGSGPAT